MVKKSEIGKIGEDLACNFLKAKGYKIIGRNLRRPWGELDIVAREPDKTLIFIEVKTLRENESIMPEENLTSAKLRKFKKAALLFAGSKIGQDHVDDKKGWRLDLIAITLKYLTEIGENYEIRHYENIG